jgi:hypothetical protein
MLSPIRACYNHFALVDDRANIILGTYTSNNFSDQLGLIPAIENTEKVYGSLKGFHNAEWTYLQTA